MISSIRALFIILFWIYTAGCTSKSNNGPVKAQKVEWTIDNGTTQSAETISFIHVNGYNYISATKGSTDIFLATPSTAVATYTQVASNAIMGFTTSGKQWSGLGCDITISSNSNSVLKGSFNATFGLVNVDTVNITGTFEDVAYY
jgi:hypothetical protein